VWLGYHPPLTGVTASQCSIRPPASDQFDRQQIFGVTACLSSFWPTDGLSSVTACLSNYQHVLGLIII